MAAAGLVVLSRGLWQPPLPPPQMILVLGGDVERERVAADLAARDGLPVLVSGGSNPEYAHWLFGRQGLDHGRVQLDYRATDTLTNFTSIVDELKRAKVRHVLLVTSSDHMQRAMLVGRLVAGSRGIGLTPVEVACGDRCTPEGWRKVWGDGARAVLWVITGRDLKGWAATRFGALLEAAQGR
ncbi:YdcF family protein [Synechococcus sp. CBW1107]|uniref:YdcF family protein n=1 Tax=Synechococcus sp. CBW1107 TaxID=2789857 RepID=UPI003A0FE08A